MGHGDGILTSWREWKTSMFLSRVDAHAHAHTQAGFQDDVDQHMARKLLT